MLYPIPILDVLVAFKPLTPEREKELIERFSKQIVDSGFSVPAEILLMSWRPLSFLTSQWGIFYLGPFLGITGNEWDNLAQDTIRLLEKEENVTSIAERVKELRTEREEKKRNAQAMVLTQSSSTSVLRKIRRLLIGY